MDAIDADPRQERNAERNDRCDPRGEDCEVGQGQAAQLVDAGDAIRLGQGQQGRPQEKPAFLLHERLLPQADHSEERQHYAHVIPDPRPAGVLQVIQRRSIEEWHQ
jgi:hypothetical protein